MAVLYLARSKIASLPAAEAAPYVEDAIPLLREAQDEPGVALCLMYSWLVAQFTDQLEFACDCFAQCISMSQELGTESLGARVYQLLGIARLDRGELGRRTSGSRTGAAHRLGAG